MCDEPAALLYKSLEIRRKIGCEWGNYGREDAGNALCVDGQGGMCPFYVMTTRGCILSIFWPKSSIGKEETEKLRHLAKLK